MHGYNLVAIYPTLEEARRVSDRLLAEGLNPADVRLTDASGDRLTSDVPREPHHERGFFDWLFASDVPEYDRDRYSAHLNERRAAVSVRAADQHWHDRIIAIMEEFNPIDIDDDGHTVTQGRTTPGTAIPAATSASTTGTTARTNVGTTGTGHAANTRTDLGATARSDMNTRARTDMSREREEVIPVVKEELEVGKRATERRYRVKTYVVEHPVEKTVTVRDERVEIEHRPISGRTGDLRMPQEREIEVVERHEEPFAEKRVTGQEEIVVRKEVVERPETVRGTVRETKVDVEKEPAGTAARTTTNTTTDRTAGTTPPRTPDRTGRR
jgi:hypothetical protein